MKVVRLRSDVDHYLPRNYANIYLTIRVDIRISLYPLYKVLTPVNDVWLIIAVSFLRIMGKQSRVPAPLSEDYYLR